MAGVRKRLGSLLGPQGVQGGQGPLGPQGLPGAEAIPTGEAIAQHLTLPGDARDALSAATARWQPYRAGESLASIRDMHTGVVDVTILGDSTTQDPWDWPRRFANDQAAAFPGMHVGMSVWGHAASEYPAQTVIQAGDDFEPGGSPFTVNDTFNRSGALAGSTPDEGGVWAGAGWSTNGTRAAASAASSRILSSGHAGDGTTTAKGVRFDTSPSTAGRQFDLYARDVDVNNHLFASLTVSAAGSVTARIYARTAGSPASLVASSAVGLTPSAVNTIDVSLTVTGNEVSATFGPTTIGPVTLTSPQVAALAAGSRYGFGTGSPANSTDITVDGFTVELLGGASAPSGWGTRFWVGGYAGSSLAYQLARLPDILGPVIPDVVVVGSCHNYGLTGPGPYLAEFNALVDAVKAVAPDAEIVASGQNPQFPGSSTTAGGIAAHAARLSALRREAGRKGWGYLPVYETFASMPDGGQIYVEADGVHPKGALATNYNGYQLWADVLTRYVNDMRLRTD